MKRKNQFQKLFSSTMIYLVVLILVLSSCQVINPKPPIGENPLGNNAEVTLTEDIFEDQIDPGTDLEPGATRVRQTDSMEMVYVPEGMFIMGSDDGELNERPIRQVYVDAFWIDKYEVTNAQYELCVADGACAKPNNDRSHTRVNYYGNPEYADHPVVFVDWYQANSYCEWAGGRLPTEAEWEKAARGPEGNLYPWGNDDANCSLANYNQGSYDQPNSCVGDTSQVGSYPEGASYYGVMDMAGNVWEWVNDWYGPYDATDTINPTGPDSEQDYKVIRGNSWYNVGSDIRSSYRSRHKPTGGNNSNFGFRCAIPQR
ncbi:MAG: formylglycine-generating enzyme family protein [Anaerolineaceae bacterium]|jgi:formylglycine-generating enzyme required for sulfatase activity